MALAVTLEVRMLVKWHDKETDSKSNIMWRWWWSDNDTDNCFDNASDSKTLTVIIEVTIAVMMEVTLLLKWQDKDTDSKISIDSDKLAWQ